MSIEHINRARIETMEQDINKLQSDMSEIDPIVVDTSFPNIKPPTPNNVLASGLFRNIMVSWDYDMSSYIGAYEVYASQDANFTPLAHHLIWRGKASSYIHEASTDETWYFRVRAINTHGTPSDFSDQVIATTARIAGLEIEEVWKIDFLKEANLYTDARKNEIMSEVATKVNADFVHNNLLLKVDLTEYNGTITRINNDMGGFMERLNVAETSITSNNEAIALRATKQELDVRMGDVVHRLDHQEGQLTIQANEIAQKVEKVEYDALTQRVSTAEGSIATQAGQIQLRATTSDLSATNQRLSTAESTITAQGNAINLRVEKNNIISQINMSPEQIKINTAKLTIDGDLEVVNGLVKLKDAIIDRVNIKQGAIDSIHIADGAITNLKVANLNADRITAGTFHINRIPHLTADKITIGATTTYANGYDPTSKIDQSGYVTSSTGADFSGRWTRVATATINSRYGIALADFTFSGGSNGNGNQTHNYWAELTFRVKQQDAFGSNPIVQLHVKNRNGLLPTHFAGIVVERSATRTVVDLYVNIPTTHERLRFTPSNVEQQSGTWAFYSAQSFVINLPTNVLEVRGVDYTHLPTTTLVDQWKWGNTTEIDGGNIRTNTITATQINVSSLSALSANLGTVTAGTLNAVTLIGATGTFSGEVSVTDFLKIKHPNFGSTGATGIQLQTGFLSAGGGTYTQSGFINIDSFNEELSIYHSDQNIKLKRVYVNSNLLNVNGTITGNALAVGIGAPIKTVDILQTTANSNSGLTVRSATSSTNAGGHLWAGTTGFVIDSRWGNLTGGANLHLQTGGVDRLVIANATGNVTLSGSIVNEAYTKATLLNGWVNYGTWEDASYWKDKNGVVHLTGLIRSGTVTNGTVLFTLPIGYRPSKHYMFCSMNGSHGVSRIDVQSNGNVVVSGNGNATWMSLAGMSFKAT